MRVLFTFSLILSSYIIQGQDTIYLIKNHSEIDKNQPEYYRLIHMGTRASDLVIKETYFISGNKESEIHTLYDPLKKIEDTISFNYAKTWYKNGNLKSLICSKDGAPSPMQTCTRRAKTSPCFAHFGSVGIIFIARKQVTAFLPD